ncbi:antitoxin Xre/MbcA/ParS toxin-binding domain-containing protein [Patulibacter defluvii]|uniref:antitoxin Xre/MbcA/ParS toxin-binding domain-containing protein n=1 Tax=Patulibacter defluvii TaxID=3095358 RepID=UPI002A74DEEA|nr:antitoxin Xre/MbcA/ParS toxin-binding domain-containing protein [Patulibacter sp. DM4]
MQEELRGAAVDPMSQALVMARLRGTFARAFDALDREVRLQVPIARRATFTDVIEALGRLANRDDDDALTTDEIDDLLTKIEAARHVLRDAVDHAGEQAVADTGQLIDQLSDWLPDVAQKDIARLLGVQPRTVQRWRAHGPRRLTERERVVLDLVAVLRHGWTSRGVLRWFERPHPDLGGAAPIDLLADAEREGELRAAAVAGRAMRAA